MASRAWWDTRWWLSFFPVRLQLISLHTKSSFSQHLNRLLCCRRLKRRRCSKPPPLGSPTATEGMRRLIWAVLNNVALMAGPTTSTRMQRKENETKLWWRWRIELTGQRKVDHSYRLHEEAWSFVATACNGPVELQKLLPIISTAQPP